MQAARSPECCPPVVASQLCNLSCGISLLCCKHAECSTHAHSTGQATLLPACAGSCSLSLQLVHAVQLVESGLSNVEGNPAKGRDEQQGQDTNPAQTEGTTARQGCM
jgi:hypothetical protein